MLMSKWLSLLVGFLLVACASQQGGGECICVYTATPTDGSATPTPSTTPQGAISATPSIQPSSTAKIENTPTSVVNLPTPTPVPIQPTFGGTEYNPECAVAAWAAPVKNLDYFYRDKQRSGLNQRVRSGPGTNYAILYTIEKDVPHTAYWLANGWVSIDPGCVSWVWSSIGELLPHQTD